MEKITFDKEEALYLVRLLVGTNTVNPPGDELLLIKKLQVLLEKEGFKVEVDEFAPNRANMIVYYPGQKAEEPYLMLTGHLDTVPIGRVPWEHDPFSCDIVDGKMYGRGICDMKGPDAAMLYAMILMKRNGVVPVQNIKFVATAGEETCDEGSTVYFNKGGMQDVGALLVGEPSNGDILVAHKGAAWVKVEFFGQTAHGSMPELGINAILQMNRFIACLSQQQFTCAPDPVVGMPSFSINTATGGSATNVVPDYAACTIDFRTIPGQTWADVAGFLDQAIAAASAGDPNYKCSYTALTPVMAPVACPAGHHIITDLDKAAGKELTKRFVRFFTDASALVTPGLPVVIYGAGDDKQAHQPNEHMYLDKFFESISVYYNFMKDYQH